MLAFWPSGSGAGDGDRDTNSRICIAPSSVCFFPRHPAVCCSFLCAWAICAMVTVPGCQLRHRFHLTSPPLPAWWLSSSCRASSIPPSSTLNDTPCSSDKVAFCHFKIIKHPARPKGFVCCWKLFQQSLWKCHLETTNGEKILDKRHLKVHQLLKWIYIIITVYVLLFLGSVVSAFEWHV